MTDPTRFEDRLTAALGRYADRAPVVVDARAVAGASRQAVTTRHWWQPARDTRGSSLRLALVGLLLLVAISAGTVLVAAALRSQDPLPKRDAVVPPIASPAAVASTEVDPCPAMTAVLGQVSGRLPSMAELRQPAAPTNGFILMALRFGQIAAIDTTGGSLALFTDGSDSIPGGMDSYVGFPLKTLGDIVPSPNGRAVAVEEAGIYLAGCGDPLVKFASGLVVRPFPSAPSETVTELAWAPDGSALYGIRRPVGDAAVTGEKDFVPAPGRLLRWVADTRTVTDLGTPCAGCILDAPAVSPDGTRIAVHHWLADAPPSPFTDSPQIAVLDPDGSWRTIDVTGELVGWTPDGHIVTEPYERIDISDIDGRPVATSGRICCHGNGYGGVLSADGTMVVGSTLSNDFLGRDLVVVDTRDGRQQTIARLPDCDAVIQGSVPRAECGSGSDPANPVIPSTSRPIAWSPDSRWLLLLDANPDAARATLRVMSADGSTSWPPIDIRLADLEGGSWDSDPAVAWLPALP